MASLPVANQKLSPLVTTARVAKCGLIIGRATTLLARFIKQTPKPIAWREERGRNSNHLRTAAVSAPAMHTTTTKKVKRRVNRRNARRRALVTGTLHEGEAEEGYEGQDEGTE